MKKLLSMIGAIALIGTTSTSVIACGGGETPKPPTPDTRSDLSTIITNTSLDKIEMVGTVPTKQELLQAIKSKNVSANTLSENDFDFEGIPTLTSATIQGKTNYKGKVTLTYEKDTRTDLSKITKTMIRIHDKLSENTKVEFLSKLQEELVQEDILKTITTNDYDVYKAGAGTVAIQDSDINSSPLEIKIVAKGNKFTGEKDKIVVFFQKDTRTDLSTITQLTGLNITADNTKTNNDLWTQIFTATEFKDLRYNSYETFMYKTNDIKDTTNIKQLNQEKGDIYIILQVNKSEGINCFGDTPRLKVTLK